MQQSTSSELFILSCHLSNSDELTMVHPSRTWSVEHIPKIAAIKGTDQPRTEQKEWRLLHWITKNQAYT